MQELIAIAKSFVNLFYPLKCPGCGGQLDADSGLKLCKDCATSIKPNAMPPFELEIPSVKAYSACLYEGTLKELIHVFKYKGRLALACVFSDIMMEYIKENPEIMDADIITAVPLHKSRLKEREFNQSMVIANKINEKLGFPVKEILEKTVKTKYQNELTKSERMTNLKGAFKVRENTGINGKRMLLIDDVMTTGATLNECAAAMLSSGAKSVTCFTLSRGI